MNDLRPGITVVNFWATWCVPCRKEIPILNRIHHRYQKQGVRFIGISVDEKSTADQVDSSIEKLPIEYAVWRGGTAREMDQLGFPFAIPSTAILQDGKVVARVTGSFKEDQLVRKLEELASKRPAH